ncbi:hypothetical protein [Desulfobacter sp.]|uniref:hypothetical protein n=1 Tax=Desulfobacter sp. TaxID=2294 RepID=UPI003D11ECE2
MIIADYPLFFIVSALIIGGYKSMHNRIQGQSSLAPQVNHLSLPNVLPWPWKQSVRESPKIKKYPGHFAPNRLFNSKCPKPPMNMSLA